MKTQSIKILDPLQSQQIAAGEVVERPANIVKELVENSIDASATTITVRIEKAGKKLISISDDGCGMSRDDAELCFARHATSKLTTVNELSNLATFGFRGEALASIAAVGRVTLTTKRHDEPLLGTQIIYHHGVRESVQAQACPVGTTFSITELFDTLPVRKAFLKQEETEWNQIQATMHGMALTHLAIHFLVYKDGTLVVDAPPVQSLANRITQLWGHSLGAQLAPVKKESRGVTIEGLASRPPYARYGKELIMFWVNGRLVKNSDITRAIVKGYKQSLPGGKYPAAFLSITLDRQEVDVNIHPRKEEVRFTKPGVITSLIEEAVTAALHKAVDARFSPVMASTSDAIKPKPYTYMLDSHAPLGLAMTGRQMPLSPVMTSVQHVANTATIDHDHHCEPSGAAVQPIHPPASPPTPRAPTPPAETSQQGQTTPQEATPFTIIGQLFDTYIIIESNDELVIVDQHAAHERILYHEYTTKFQNKEGTSLLFPLTVTLPSPHATALLLTHQEFFADQGITFSQTGPQHLTVHSSPPRLREGALDDLLIDAADFIGTHQTLEPNFLRKKLNEHVHSHLACKMAVRAGDRLSIPAMTQLIQTLLQTPERFMCIHGRPTMMPIGKTELERKFKRRT